MPKYIKKDTELGYVEDSAHIEYLKFNNMRHIILGCMLGDYDEEGRYVVDPEIVRELVAMRKYIVETIDNIDICVSELKLDKQISFAVTLEGNRATLSLLEKVNYEANFKLNSGAYSNINEYILDEVETSGVVDKNVLYRRWNINPNGGSVLDVFNMDEETLAQYFGLVNRFKYLLKANQILLEKEAQIEAIETKHIIDTLDLVARFPKLKAEVDKKLKQELNDKKNIICIDKPNFAKTLNELVTQVIDSNTNVLTEEELKEFEIDKHNINNNYNIEMRDVVDTKAEVVNDNGQEYTKIILDTHGVELNETVNEVALESVRAQKDALARARGEVVDNINNPRDVNLNGELEGYSPREVLGEYFRKRVGYELNNNVAVAIEKEDVEVIDTGDSINNIVDEKKVVAPPVTSDGGSDKKGDNKKKANLVKKATDNKKKSTAEKKPASQDNKKAPAQRVKGSIPVGRRKEEEQKYNDTKILDSHRGVNGNDNRVVRVELASRDDTDDAFNELNDKAKVRQSKRVVVDAEELVNIKVGTELKTNRVSVEENIVSE